MTNRRVGEKLPLILLFLAFVISRAFVASPFYLVSMDEAKYLALAGAFPKHTLFGNGLYLVHPPLFPYLVRLFGLGLPDHTAGIAVSFFFAVVTFLAAVGLFRFFKKGYGWIAVALLVLTVSPLHVSTSQVVYKESMFLGLFLLSLLFYIKGIARARGGCLFISGLAGAGCCLTSDLGVYLLPSLLLAFFLFRTPSTRLTDGLGPLLLAFIPYGGWLLARWIVYRGHLTYPAGVDGTIEAVGEFTLRQLFTPRYFPETVKMFDFNPGLSRFGFHPNVYPLGAPWKIPPLFTGAICALSALGALYGTVHEVRKGASGNRAALFFSLLFLVFALPVFLRPEPRFVIPILIPMGYLIAEGVLETASRLLRIPRGTEIVAWICALVLLLLAVGSIPRRKNSVFSLEKEVEGARLAGVLNTLPGEGVMAQVGYPPEIAYLTEKAVVAMPLSPEKLDEFIRLYDIDYLVYGQHYWAPLHERNAPSIWCYPTIRHIRASPGRYPLLEIVDERYRSKDWPDRVFVHAVRGNRIPPEKGTPFDAGPGP